MASTSKTTRDHEEIRGWAEARGGQPACVRNTGGKGDIGILRLDFPGFSGEDTLEHISWEEWFKKFDESNLALLFQEETARGEKSNFNKIVSSETADEKEERPHRPRGSKQSSGKKTPAKTAASTKSASGTAAKKGPAAKKAAAKKTAPRKTVAKAPAGKKPGKKTLALKKTAAPVKVSPKKAAAKKSSAKKKTAARTR